MYLKEIEISGFKSFADKININLDNNITCVVGPNGSGKSNINTGLPFFDHMLTQISTHGLIDIDLVASGMT